MLKHFLKLDQILSWLGVFWGRLILMHFEYIETTFPKNLLSLEVKGLICHNVFEKYLKNRSF